MLINPRFNQGPLRLNLLPSTATVSIATLAKPQLVNDANQKAVTT
jgi:hypothetical protein